MSLVYPVEISGMNFGGWYSATDPNGFPIGSEEEIQPYLDKLWGLGVRHIRNGGTWFATANQSAQETARLTHAKGFTNIYGVVFPKDGTNLTPSSWKSHETNFILPSVTVCAVGDVCDIFSIGNEEEEQIDTEPVTSLVRASNVVTATFAAAHYYLKGDTVVIAGATPSDYNGTITITDVPTSTTFTYTAAGVDGSATGTLTAKMTVPTFIRLAKETAVLARAIAPNLDYIISSTGTQVAFWAAAKLNAGVDLDYHGLQTYSSSSTDLASFRSIIQTEFDGLGNKMWLTEWNLYFNWSTVLSQVNIDRMIRETKARMNIIQEIGVSRAFYYASTVLNHDYEIIRHPNLEPRNAYYAFFSDRESVKINQTSGTGTIVDPTTPISSLRQALSVDRGKCIDFNQGGSYLTGTYPSTFTQANLATFTVAVRLYPHTVGGGSAGRIISSVNQKFIELYTASTGYNCQVWHTTTNGAATTGSNSIIFNKWQTLFVTFTEGDNYPRLYIDMVEKTSSPSNKSGSRGPSSGEVLSIGNRSDLIRGYDGLMDDLFIWNRILSTGEMNSYKNGNIPGDYLLGYTMDEASGTVIDIGSSSADLTVADATQNITSYAE